MIRKDAHTPDKSARPAVITRKNENFAVRAVSPERIIHADAGRSEMRFAGIAISDTLPRSSIITGRVNAQASTVLRTEPKINSQTRLTYLFLTRAIYGFSGKSILP